MNNIQEIKKIIKTYLDDKKTRNIGFISEEQEKFLRENKGILFEYYGQVSNPRGDTNILGDLQIWVYGNDRKDFTPHCHVFTRDKSIEVEISIIDWKIIKRVKGKFNRKLRKAFDKWLVSKSTRDPNQTNKMALFIAWDSDNPNNDILSFVSRHNTRVEDEELIKYLDSQQAL